IGHQGSVPAKGTSIVRARLRHACPICSRSALGELAGRRESATDAAGTAWGLPVSRIQGDRSADGEPREAKVQGHDTTPGDVLTPPTLISLGGPRGGCISD